MKNYFTIAIILCIGQTLCGQQLNLSSNTHYNLFQENLAFAGNYEASHFTADYMRMWAIEGAPEHYQFALHSPSKSKRLGFGLNLSSSQLGVHSELHTRASIVYKLALSSGRISFGLGLGAVHYNFNSDLLNPAQPEDQLLLQSSLNSIVPNIDFAVIYTTQKSYIGLELNQLNQADWNLSELDSSSQQLHFKLSAGQVFVLENDNFLRTSAHVRGVGLNETQIDGLINFCYQSRLWLGGGLRWKSGLLLNLEFNFTKRLQAGYISNIPLFHNNTSIGNTHTLFVGYMLPKNKKKAPSFRNF